MSERRNQRQQTVPTGSMCLMGFSEISPACEQSGHRSGWRSRHAADSMHADRKQKCDQLETMPTMSTPLVHAELHSILAEDVGTLYPASTAKRATGPFRRF